MVTNVGGTVRPNILAQQLAGASPGTRQVVIRQPLTAGTPTLQKIVPGGTGGNTVVVSGGQVFTTSTGQHIVVASSAQAGTNTTGVLTATTGGSPHFVIGPGSRLATIGGQQVLIRTGPTNSVLTLAAAPGTQALQATGQGNMLVKTVTTPGSIVKSIKSPLLTTNQASVGVTQIQVNLILYNLFRFKSLTPNIFFTFDFTF